MLAAFPASLRDHVTEVADLLPTTRLGTKGLERVWIAGESIAIPYRQYDDEPAESVVRSLSPSQQTVLHCWYTRHHDGHVRERHLVPLIPLAVPWVAPYVVQLAGEYIYPILQLIQRELCAEDLDSARSRLYGQFTRDNPRFVDLTASRVASYWDAYFRSRSDLDQHPGHLIIQWLRSAAKQTANAV